MAELSQTDRDIISRHPLNDSLEHLRDALRRTEDSYRRNTSLDESARNSAAKQTISRLVSALLAHEVALELEWKTRQDDVAAELAIVFGRIRREDFVYERYRLLVQLVINKASDVDIWLSVLNLITLLSQLTTPPASVLPSYNSTPVTYSSASQQGSEQTKRLLDLILLHELRNCTYRGVEGFCAKYFENKEWSDRAGDIYTALKDSHINGRWASFPDPPEEKAVWNWLSCIQDELFSDARGAYYTTSTVADLTGAEAPRQLDLFIKKKTNTIDTKHDWKDVRVIGELSGSIDCPNTEWKDKFLQLGGYVRDLFSVQPTRQFVHAFTLLGTAMELWVFDRSGPYSSGPFNIHEEPERFVRAIVGYAMMSDAELGLDTFTQHNEHGPFIAIEEDLTGQETKIQLEEKPIVINRAIVCRGTTCFRSKDQSQVVKMSWLSALRPPEARLLRLARDCGVEGVAHLVGYRHITDTENLRHGLTFPTPYRFPDSVSTTSTFFSESDFRGGPPRCLSSFKRVSQCASAKRKRTDIGTLGSKQSRSSSRQSKLREEYDGRQETDERAAKQDDQGYTDRVLSCLVISPAGCLIGEFRSIKELLTALLDAIKGHYSLISKAKIIHRDVSDRNVIITYPKTADDRTGWLIDLDLAIILGERSSA